MSGGNQYKSNTLCVLPFIHLATHPIGTVTPCCVTDMTNDMSTAKKDGFNLFLSKDSLEDISNSESFKSLRKKMINNEEPYECYNCYLQEKNNIISKRIESNNEFSHLIDHCFNSVNNEGELEKIDYRYLELRLGSVCNLKCVTCNSFSSNRWNEDISIFDDTKFKKFHFKNVIKTEWYRDQNFYDQLFDKCENLEKIWINGGEPTIIREHGYFLDKLISSGIAKKIDLNYSINVTNLPDDLLEKWKEFKKVHIQLSVDDLYGRNEYIRYPSDWNVIYSNLEKIKQYGFELELMQTVSLYNVYNIDNFKKFSIDLDIYVAHNYVNYPSFLHVSIIPENMKNEIIDNIKYLNSYEIDKLKFEFNKTQNIYNIGDFIEYVKLLDIKRNIKIQDFLHEWKHYF
jgi:organic radical activating enzyme